MAVDRVQGIGYNSPPHKMGKRVKKLKAEKPD